MSEPDDSAVPRSHVSGSPPAPGQTGVVVDVAGVQHAYRRTMALRGVDLSVAAGEVVAVTGPSGCGKSTLLHVAAGLVPAQTGRVCLLGHDLSGLDPDRRARLRRREVGIVLQYGQLVPELTGLDNVALPLLLEGVAPDASRQLAAQWLDQCGADQVADVPPVEMSGGQAQRVALARALVTGPRVVFADEPTGSLDSLAGRQLLSLLVAAARRNAASVVLVTHDNTVAAHADREVRLVDGVVVSSAGLQ